MIFFLFFYQVSWAILDFEFVYADQTTFLDTLRLGQNGCHFADDLFKYIFNENVWISSKITLMFVPKGPIDNIPALVQIMAWRRPGDKPLSEPMLVRLPMHICIAQPQWVNMANEIQPSLEAHGVLRLISLSIMKYNEGNSGHIRTPDRCGNIGVTVWDINRHTLCVEYRWNQWWYFVDTLHRVHLATKPLGPSECLG